jgi:peptidoglycan/LPS O-acetylase OafA/YrhL
MKYRREIDGLRAVAVLPVIFFHAGFSVFSGGYIGVDVFFVISGYLITSILISEVEHGVFCQPYSLSCWRAFRLVGSS